MLSFAIKKWKNFEHFQDLLKISTRRLYIANGNAREAMEASLHDAHEVYRSRQHQKSLTRTVKTGHRTEARPGKTAFTFCKRMFSDHVFGPLERAPWKLSRSIMQCIPLISTITPKSQLLSGKQEEES